VQLLHLHIVAVAGAATCESSAHRTHGRHALQWRGSLHSGGDTSDSHRSSSRVCRKDVWLARYREDTSSALASNMQSALRDEYREVSVGRIKYASRIAVVSSSVNPVACASWMKRNRSRASLP
jgi:hypothetical protein